MQPFVISVIGAGGKTTALRTLARALSDHRVLLTTTTHIYPIAPPESRILLTAPSENALLEALIPSGIVCAGSAATEDKLGALPSALLAQAIRAADVTLCEADGAHLLPLKLHRPDEPVLPADTSLCLIVAGLSALGRPVCETVHRYARNPDWARTPRQAVGIEQVLYCVREAVSATGLPSERLRVLLNQADTPALREQALSIAHFLTDEGLDCRVGSLQDAPSFLSEWLLPASIVIPQSKQT